MRIESDNYIEISHPRFIVDLMYAKKDNIALCDAYQKIGFGNRAYCHKDLWNKLEKLIPILVEKGLFLKIFDAYRPPLAHNILLDAVPVPNFFASSPEKSPHCRAIAIDVCLCDNNKTEFEYPTPVDAYSPYFANLLQKSEFEEFSKYLQKASHSYIDSSMIQQIENRKFLKLLMESVGLKSLEHEWWHYNLVDRDLYQTYPLVEF